MRRVCLVNRALFASLVMVALFAGASFAHEQPTSLGPLAHRIAGGASLLSDLTQSPSASRFHDRAHHFEDAVGERSGGHLTEDWRDLRDAFEQARHELAGGESRLDFLLAHLQEDIALGDRLVASITSEPPNTGYTGNGPGTVSFVNRTICVGTTDVGRPCPSSRGSQTFRIPREVSVIRRLNAEWRDFGANSNVEIYVNDRLVWRTDTPEDWASATIPLNVQIQPGSTLTVRSSDGDPIWIRRLNAETLRATASDESYRNPWDFLWQERQR